MLLGRGIWWSVLFKLGKSDAEKGRAILSNCVTGRAGVSERTIACGGKRGVAVDDICGV